MEIPKGIYIPSDVWNKILEHVVYKVALIPTYGCRSWLRNSRDENRLDAVKGDEMFVEMRWISDEHLDQPRIIGFLIPENWYQSMRDAYNASTKKFIPVFNVQWLRYNTMTFHFATSDTNSFLNLTEVYTIQNEDYRYLSWWSRDLRHIHGLSKIEIIMTTYIDNLSIVMKCLSTSSNGVMIVLARRDQ